MNHYLVLTTFGYGFIAIIALSLFISYKFLKKDTTKNVGCFSLALTFLIVSFSLIFAYTISIELIQKGTPLAQYLTIGFWVLLIGGFLISKLTQNTKKFWDIILKILKYIAVLIFFGLFCVLYFGMFFYLYKIFFTDSEQQFELWAGMLCVFFTSVLTPIIFIVPFNNRKKNDSEKTFYLINKALLKPEIVYNLDLSLQNLVDFPRDILKMMNLTNLNLSNNSLSEITSDISILENLETLDLRNNQLNDLPIEFKTLKKLKTLNLNGNPISDAKRYEIRNTFSSIQITF